MAENPEPAKPDKSEKKKFWNALGEFLWDRFWKWVGFDWVGADLKDQATIIPPHAKARVVGSLVVLMMVVCVLAIWVSNCRRNNAAETARNTAQAQTDLATKFREDRDSALRQLATSERKNEGLERERDRLDDRLKRGEQSVNLQVQTNVAPDIRLDAILRQLKSLGSDAYDFSFLINHADVTNDSVVVLGDNNEVKIGVKNLGEITAKGLTITFSPHTSATNINADLGWRARGNNTLMVGTNDLGLIPVFDTVSEALVPPGMIFGATPFTILNSYTNPILRAKIAAFAERTKEHSCYINFVITSNVLKYLPKPP